MSALKIKLVATSSMFCAPVSPLLPLCVSIPDSLHSEVNQIPPTVPMLGPTNSRKDAEYLKLAAHESAARLKYPQFYALAGLKEMANVFNDSLITVILK